LLDQAQRLHSSGSGSAARFSEPLRFPYDTVPTGASIVTDPGPHLTVVTAASSNHFGALVQMLESLARLEARVECYDIGLTVEEVDRLPRWPRCVHHRFDYAAYPAHLNVEVNAGEYAWKPVIVADVVDRVRAAENGSDVLWADAGCFFHSLAPIAERIRESGGLWVRPSAGVMREWTHPLMFDYLRVDPGEYAERRNADATMVGFAVGSAPPDARERVCREIVTPWKACALAKDCIAPAGSSRQNHRQDQAVLSYLIHRAGYGFVEDTWRDVAVRTKCDRWFYHYVGFDVPAFIYARTCLS
jgi:hypothetical protein